MLSLKYKKIAWPCMLQLVLLAFALAACWYHHLSPAIGIRYFVFQLFGVLVPGLAAFLFFDLKNRNGIVLVGMGYSLGLILLIIEYLIAAAAGIQRYSQLLSSFIAICSIVYIVKREDWSWENPTGHKKIRDAEEEGIIDNQSWMVCFLFILFILLMDLLTVSFVNTIPGEVNGNGYYVDWLFWTGNNISFTKGFPPQDYRLWGEVFNYHYFSSILMAQTHFITGIDTVILSFYYSFMIPAILLVTVACMLFSSVLTRREYLVLAMLITLFTEGSSLTFIWHIYFCPFGYDYGYIFGMLSIYVLLELVKKRKICVRHIILSAALIAMTTGCKGPVGIVVLMGFGVAALYFLCQKKYKKALLLGGVWLGAFLLTYLIFISGDITASESSLKFLGIKEAFKANPYIQMIFSDLTGIYRFPGGRLTKIISIFLYVYNINKAAILLFLVGAAYLLYGWFHKNADPVLLILSAICPWGIALTINTRQVGGSEMYFIMSVIPYGVAGGFYALEKMHGIKASCRKLILSAVVITMYLNISSFLNHAYFKAVQGVMCINRQLDLSEFPVYYATSSEYEAYQWLKDNTGDRDVIAIDYIFDVNSQTQEMVAGVFSERYIWNDGKYSANRAEVERRKEIVARLVNGELGAVKELKENGVAYFMQNLNVNPFFYLEDEYGTCVYENASFRVYELR